MAEQTTLLGGEVPQPLAARMRPNTLEEFVGQKQLLGEGRVLRRLIASDTISSMIFWGPPGVGKETSKETRPAPQRPRMFRPQPRWT